MQRIERLVWHYEAEARLTQRLARDAGSLARYPQARARVLATAERVRERAERLRRALDALERPVTEPAPPSGRPAGTVWASLRDRVSDLGDMSESALMDAQAVEREHPVIARLLYDVYRETAEDRRDLIWTLAQLAGTAIRTTSVDDQPVAA
jgi:hypothetical protein